MITTMTTRKAMASLMTLVLLFGACTSAAAPSPTAPPRATAIAIPTSTPVPPAGAVTSTPTPTPRAAPTSTPGTVYGGTFRYAHPGALEGWDSLSISARGTHNVSGLLYDRPMRYNPGPPQCQFLPRVPSAVESWKWVDSTTFEMKLRQGMRFHNKPPVNGREATANDLIFTIMKAGTKPAVYITDVQAAVAKAEAIDKYTVRLNFKELYAIMPDRLPQEGFYLYAPEAVGDDLAVTKPEEAIGTGPFMFKDEKPGVSVTLEKHPNYWEKGLPYVDAIDFKIVPDGSTRAALFRTGQIDLVQREPIPITATLEKMPRVTVHKCSDLITLTLKLNPSVPPFNDVRVRRAVSMAIDRKVVVDTVVMGRGESRWVRVPHPVEDAYLKLEDYPPEVRQYLEYNPAKAKALLAEAGYPAGLNTEINYSAIYANSRELSEALNDMFAKAGIKAKIVEWPSGPFAAKRAAEEFGMHLYLALGYPGSFQWVRAYHSVMAAPTLRAGVKDPLLDELSVKLTQTADAAEQKALQKQLQIQAVSQAYDPLSLAAEPVVIMQPWVKNVYFQPVSLLQIVDWLWRVQLAR